MVPYRTQLTRKRRHVSLEGTLSEECGLGLVIWEGEKAESMELEGDKQHFKIRLSQF
jgi:hypothetical protein